MREHLEDLIQEVEVRNLNIANNCFLIKDIKGEFTRETETNMEIAVGNSLIITSRPQVEGELMHELLIKKEETLVVDSIITPMLTASINIICMSNKQRNMAPLAVYAAGTIILPSTVKKVNMI